MESQSGLEEHDHQSELTDAARRAGAIFNEHISSIVDESERRAKEITRGAEQDAAQIQKDAAQLQKAAERDAEDMRREALVSARRVFERINALERPFVELVQTLRSETDRVERELSGHVDAESAAIPSEAESRLDDDAAALQDTVEVEGEELLQPAAEEPPAEPESAEEPPAEPESEELKSEEPESEEVSEQTRAYAVRDVPAAAAEPIEPAATPEPAKPTTTSPTVRSDPAPAPPREPAPTFAGGAEVAEKGGRGIMSKLRGGGKQSAFITAEGHCAVCQKPFMAGSEENLHQSGWKVSGDVGVCPEDQADGWQLPDGAKLPFRRGGS